MIQMRDLDHDGYVSSTEHRSWAAEVFAAMDQNTDGKLTRDEYLSVRMGPGQRAAGMGQRRAAMQARMRERKLERFTAMDPDGDGIVTREQFMRQTDRNFAELDTNGDGKVGIGEFRSWHRGM